MREILFRGKRVDNGEWVYGYPLIDNAPCSAKEKGYCKCPHDGSVASIFAWVDDYHEYQEFEVDPETVGQYTGLTDKNGKKIFEGDILNENGYLFTVVYDQYWAKFKLQHDGRAIQYPEWNRGIKMEIVGNIHDNPELLKEERT